jgi:hypothetical protein
LYSQQLRSALCARAPPAVVRAVARAAVLALPLLAPVLAVARAAVLAPVLLAPVLAVARAAVPALVLLAPVLTVARAAVPALALLAPVLAATQFFGGINTQFFCKIRRPPPAASGSPAPLPPARTLAKAHRAQAASRQLPHGQCCGLGPKSTAWGVCVNFPGSVRLPL